MIAVRLTKGIEEHLNSLAKNAGCAKTLYVREAILEYIDDLEDHYLSDKRLEDLRSGRTCT
jgi:RHH-type transcriptional regulator, rel operon repressor / antitoxin RelB